MMEDISFQESEASILNNEEVVKYGELVVFGYNGCLPPRDRGRKRSKFVLYRRSKPNGLKESACYSVEKCDTRQVFIGPNQYKTVFDVNEKQKVIVEYTLDEKTDLFQIGRSADCSNDCVVCCTFPEDSRQEGADTVPRFACRILVDREDPNVVCVYPGGFDSSHNMLVKRKDCKWPDEGNFDGLISNGLLIKQPEGLFKSEATTGGMWREVSIKGKIFSVRRDRSTKEKGERIESENNTLRDGTLIDLCGAVLLWRSAEGLKESPTKATLEALIRQMNAYKPECEFGNTAVIPRWRFPPHEEERPGPHIFFRCGHVQLEYNLKQEEILKCPVCAEEGRAAKLCMGMEPAFYIDTAPPKFAFEPCGHMTTEKTVQYWSQIPIQHGLRGYSAFCPFCATPLEGTPGYSELVLN